MPTQTNVLFPKFQAVTVAEAAKRLTLHRMTIYNAVKAGTLPARKVGRRILIRESDLQAWFESLPKL